eukprot:gene10500-11631_t
MPFCDTLGLGLDNVSLWCGDFCVLTSHGADIDWRRVFEEDTEDKALLHSTAFLRQRESKHRA